MPKINKQVKAKTARNAQLSPPQSSNSKPRCDSSTDGERPVCLMDPLSSNTDISTDFSDSSSDESFVSTVDDKKGKATKQESASGSDQLSSSESDGSQSDTGDEIKFSFRPNKSRKKRHHKNVKSAGPMKLSRRLSYKLTRENLTPIDSPIAALRLVFTPFSPSPQSERRASRATRARSSSARP